MLPPPTPPPPPSDADTDPSPPVYSHFPVRYDQNETAEPSGNVALGNEVPSTSSGGQAVPSSPYPDDTFFDIAPRADATSFQVGYLGLEGFQSWIKGDVLVKLDPAIRSSGKYEKCTISLTAEEVTTSERVELFSAHQTLWRALPAAPSPVASTSRESAALLESAQVPSTLPFSFSLTSDLPHCIHLPASGIAYSLEAKLVPTVELGPSSNMVKMAPVHLTRYSPPGPLSHIVASAAAENSAGSSESSLTTNRLKAHTWRLTDPVPMSVQLARTLFRRAEPIDVRIRIPPLPTGLQSEKELRLRAVEATLVRTIAVRQSSRAEADRSHKSQKQRAELTDGTDTWRVAETDDIPGYAAAAASSGSSTIMPPSQEELGTPPRGNLEPRVEATLATSGKLCRFNSSRPILLRLSLHPPFARVNMPFPHPDHDAPHGGAGFGAGRGGGGGCESITQETLAHKVGFLVRIKISMRGARSESRDVCLEKEITVIPGAAGGEAPPDDGAPPSQAHQARSPADEKRAAMSGADKTTASSSARVLDLAYAAEGDLPFEHFDSEEEYDGFEDVGRALDDESEVEEPAHRTEAARLLDVLAQSSGTAAEGSLRRTALRAMHAAVAPRREEEDGGEPPPSLLESQHDLQLTDGMEVEVAGVGFAMPRRSSLSPLENAEEHLPPAFEIAETFDDRHDAAGPPLDPDLSGYAARIRQDTSSAAQETRHAAFAEDVQLRVPGQWSTSQHLEADEVHALPSPPRPPEWSQSPRLLGQSGADAHRPEQALRRLRESAASSTHPPSFAHSVNDSSQARHFSPGERTTPQPPPYADGSDDAGARADRLDNSAPSYQGPGSAPRQASGVSAANAGRRAAPTPGARYLSLHQGLIGDSSDRAESHDAEASPPHPAEYEAHVLPPAYPVYSLPAPLDVESAGVPQRYEDVVQPMTMEPRLHSPRMSDLSIEAVDERQAHAEEPAGLSRTTNYGPPSYEA